MLKLLTQQEIYLKGDAYLNELVEQEDGTKKWVRVKKYGKPKKYTQADWKRATDAKKPRQARLRLKLVFKEIQRLCKEGLTELKRLNKLDKEKDS